MIYKRFLHHIQTQFPMLFKHRIAVAISGGLDSVTLAHLLHEAGLKPDFIHVNFNLRGADSHEDALFVKQLAQSIGVSCHVKSVDTTTYAAQQQLSIQMAARALRYDYFEDLVRQDVVDYVLTAHHLDDQLETFLINLGRGTGLRGLTGIPEKSAHILRPLLPFSREELLEFTLSRKLNWREDSSNASDKYLRNSLRHNVIPALKKASPHLMQTLSSTFQNLGDAEFLMNAEVARFTDQAVDKTQDDQSIAIDFLRETGRPEAYLYELLKGKGFHIGDAVQLMQAESGKTIYGTHHRLIKDRDRLWLANIQKAPSLEYQVKEFTASFKLGKRTFFMAYVDTTEPLQTLRQLGNEQSLLLDADQVRFPFIIRNWNQGDKMKPLGLNGHKKVSDLLIDHKISVLEKENCLVLKSNQNILWLVGIRTSNHYKITTSTKRILRIWFTH